MQGRGEEVRTIDGALSLPLLSLLRKDLLKRGATSFSLHACLQVLLQGESPQLRSLQEELAKEKCGLILFHSQKLESLYTHTLFILLKLHIHAYTYSTIDWKEIPAEGGLPGQAKEGIYARGSTQVYEGFSVRSCSHRLARQTRRQSRCGKLEEFPLSMG